MAGDETGDSGKPGEEGPPDTPPAESSESAEESEPQWRPVWLVPLLIGLVTVTAGLFTWRAGQLGSSAAYEDRTSVGQTIRQEEQTIEATLGAVDDTVVYVGYVADFAEAESLDDLADELRTKGREGFAREFEEDADELRRAATESAAAAGVFGRQTLLAQTVSGSDDPLPFDFDDQKARIEAEVSIGVRGPGVLEPDRWAQQADDTRARVRALRFAALLLIGAVAALTIAQLGRRRPARWAGLVAGCSVFVVVTAVTLVTVY